MTSLLVEAKRNQEMLIHVILKVFYLQKCDPFDLHHNEK
jgi:hypothetical protein